MNRTAVTLYGRFGGSILAALAITLLIVGCKAKTIPIKDLLANTGGYDGQTVQVSGTVKSSAGAFGHGVYELDDGTGTIPVVTEKGGTPAQGAKVGVRGTFHSAFTIGTDVVAVIKESARYEP